MNWNNEETKRGVEAISRVDMVGLTERTLAHLKELQKCGSHPLFALRTARLSTIGIQALLERLCVKTVETVEETLNQQARFVSLIGENERYLLQEVVRSGGRESKINSFLGEELEERLGELPKTVSALKGALERLEKANTAGRLFLDGKWEECERAVEAL